MVAQGSAVSFDIISVAFLLLRRHIFDFSSSEIILSNGEYQNGVIRQSAAAIFPDLFIMNFLKSSHKSCFWAATSISFFSLQRPGPFTLSKYKSCAFVRPSSARG